MEVIHLISIVVGVILCIVFAAPLKWWIDDLRVASVEKKIIVCKFKIDRAQKFLEECSDMGTLYANGTQKASEWTVLKKQEIEKEELKLQLLEYKLNKLKPPMFLADEGL